jgi:hypothetical protein
VAHQHHGTGSGGTRSQVGVEHLAPQRHGMVGQLGVPRPRRADLAAPVGQADPGETVSTEVQRIDVEQAQFAQGTWGERVAARLVPGDRSLLDDGDVVAGTGEPGGDRCPRRTTADDEDVGVQGAPPVSQPGENRESARGRPA